jgi:RNA polymerase sigma factor (sigma-70 family)
MLGDGYRYGLIMFSVVTLHPEAIDSQEVFNRPEGRVEDSEGIYEELIAPMEARMIRSIWRVVRSPEMAEDALQDALAVVWKKIHLIRRHPNPPALILKICLNAAYDSLRRCKHFRHHEEISVLDDMPGPSGRGALQRLSARETEEEVLRAIGRLPRKQATAILMRILDEEPFEVIAGALGCSEITARIHVSKGRARLQRWLAHLGPSFRKEGSDGLEPRG